MRSLHTFVRALCATEGTSKSMLASRPPSHRGGTAGRVGFRARVALPVVLTAVLLSLCASASAAKYVSSFGSFTNIQGIAVDDSSGAVYVYDAGLGEIFKFDASGAPSNFTATGTNTISGVGSPFGGGEAEIAVDNSSGPDKGDIYIAIGGTANIGVYDVAGNRVGELGEAPGVPWGEACGIAVDGSGSVYVGVYAGYVNKYVPSSGTVTNVDYASSIRGAAEPCNVAVDSLGNVFAVTYNQGPVTRYEASQFGSLSAVGSTVDNAGSTLAVDIGTDELYVDDGAQIARFGPHGEPFQAPTSEFGSSGPGAVAGSYGIAVGGRDLYVADGKGQVSIFSTALHAPDVAVTKVTSLHTEGSATLNGTVNPKGLEVELCQFEYASDGEYKLSGKYGSAVPCSTGPGSGSAPVLVAADITGLTPGTLYHYRLTAANAEGENSSRDATFIAPEQPAISGGSVSAITSASATFSAQMNPGGAETTFQVEYGPTTSYGISSPVPAGYVGSDLTSATVYVHAQDLLAGTTYHFRFVASNVVGAEYSPDQTFSTQAAGGGLVLPDGRAYEMVSPSQKGGAEATQTFRGGAMIQAAEAGDGLAYLADAPIGSEPGSSPTRTQVMARRGQREWASTDISIPGEYSPRVGTGLGDMLFSSDLSLTAAEPLKLLKPISSEVPATLKREVYLHDTSSTVYRPLVTSAPSVPTQFPFEGVRLAGATPDLSHVVLGSYLALTPNAVEGHENVYVWSSGELELASILPDGTSAVDATLGGTGGENTRHAISDDGSRVVWSVGSDKALYVRDMATERSQQVDAAQGGTQSGEGVFRAASSDATKIFFTDGKPLTSDAFRTDLYVFDASSGSLTNLTQDQGDSQGADVRSVLGASEDGEEVYFVAGGGLAPGAVVGANNLYLARHAGATWETTLIATLSEDDARGVADEGDLIGLSARVSPDGHFLAFMSNAKLTGYDNRDANSGQSDEEVYLYNHTAESLRCVSCNPTGARPVGEYDTGSAPLAMDPTLIWFNRWLAATIPGWTPMSHVVSPYQPRYLSDSGRLFFNSSDALVGGDSNGREDVYEYEPSGTGSCSEEAGCVSLISSGTGGSDAAFLDASGTGDDVFFLTHDRLLPQDFDTNVDVYDARACTASHPCFPVQPAVPPPCVTGDSCKPAPAPAPGAFGAPASATFAGEGNVKPASPTAVKKKATKKRQTRHKRKKRSRASKRSQIKGRGTQARAGVRKVTR